MAYGSLGYLVGNFLEAFSKSKLLKEEHADREQQRKLQTQLFDLQLKKAQQQEQAQEVVRQKLNGLPLAGIPKFSDAPGGLGLEQTGTTVPKGGAMSLTQMLADPEAAIALLQSGDLKDVMGLQNAQRAQATQEQMFGLMKGAMGGGGGNGAPGGSGYELTGFGMSPNGEFMPDFKRSTMDEPLKPGDLAIFRDKNGGLPQPGTTMRQLIDQGFRQLTSAQQDTEGSVRGVTQIMQNLSGLTGRVFQAGSSLVDRALAAGANEWNRIAQENPDIVLYEDILQGSLSPVVRALGEKGSLAEGDVNRVISLFPKTRPLPDTAEVAKAKITAIGSILAAAQGGNTEEAKKLIQATSAQFGPQVIDFHDLPAK
jgi:hypothetical protein